MTEPLFGTDGVRGVAGKPPLDRDTVSRLGAALAEHLKERRLPHRILMAGDTRRSTPEIAAWLAEAFTAGGGEVAWGGVLPTPAVSHLLRDLGGFGGGVVISASHNPAGDNGIKLVTADGSKWPVEDERRLEQRLGAAAAGGSGAPLPEVEHRFSDRFVELVLATLPGGSLGGLRLVVDAAHGAAAPVAAGLFARLGAAVEMVNDRPDGRNINAACGALHPEGLAAGVIARGADAGVALDGDADRAILVTHTGRVLNGDDVLLLWARSLAAAGRLDGSKVVATVMSNLALEHALGRKGVSLVRCPVGDREVWQAMRREGAVLGGEQSGHVICSRYSVTGDGLLTAAHVLAAVVADGRPLEELADLEPLPQVLVNVRLARRRPIQDVPELDHAVRDATAALGGRGRVLVRFSGTEPLLRIMVEADRRELAESLADELVGAARHALG